jgi:putative FmdB family regulatory protein
MPTYGYECKSCGHTFDAFQAMSDEPLKTCPQCGKELRRLINGGSGIIFKGSGFYVTDKGSKGGAAAGPAKSPEKPSGNGPEKAASGDASAAPSSSSATPGAAPAAPEKKAAG